jgi:hypothetical protein
LTPRGEGRWNPKNGMRECKCFGIGNERNGH